MSIPRDVTWPAGTLRPFESVHAVTVKLAIFNHVVTSRYENTVRECSARALARLLHEPLARVRTVVEKKAWHRRVELFISSSVILKERNKYDRQEAINLKYCAKCAANFYHSWIHSLSWLDYCFVHHDVRLTIFEKYFGQTDTSALMRGLHTLWSSNFGEFLRTPERFEVAFSSLSTHKILRRERALEALFVSRDGESVSGCSSATTSAVFPFEQGATPSRLSVYEDSERKPWKREQDGQEGEGAHVGRGDSLEGRQSDVLLLGRAPSRSALICGAASTLSSTTEHPLNEGYQPHLVYRGSVEFELGSKVPDFWAHLTYLLSTGEDGPERTLLEDFLKRLSVGHEDCLQVLEDQYAAGAHLAVLYDPYDDRQYLAYRLRKRGVCPRLVTFDLVTFLLRPSFLHHTAGWHALTYRTGRSRVGWVHAAFGPVKILESPEWRQYICTYDPGWVFPKKSGYEDFAHHLRALEWALFRKERRSAELGPIELTANDTVRDLQMVVIGCESREYRPYCTYFDGDEASCPDWSTLSNRYPAHANDSFRALINA